MAQEVGVAYVTLLPSGKGFGRAVEGQIDDAFGKADKQTAGFFGKLRTGLKWVGVGVAAVATTVAGLSIKGGISRALNIEDAQAKLKGLGHDTQTVERIMSDALASVRGTAYGLDTAATVAATAVAAGIEPGKELEKYLRLTADAATIAGTSMEEMGSILNKTTTSGKVFTQELNQLADRGLPVFQWLQEEYQVSAEELRKMVAGGEIEAERFRKVIEENIGGAALASGDTTRGAFANMRAAMSRFGLALIGDTLPQAKTFFGEMIIIFDGLTERANRWLPALHERLGDVFNLDGMGERFLDRLDRAIEAFSSGPIVELFEALKPLFPLIGDLAKSIGSTLGDAFLTLLKAFEPFLPVIIEALDAIVADLVPALVDLVLALLPLLPDLVKVLAELTPLVATLVELLIPAIQGIGGLLSADQLTKMFMDGKISAEEYLERINAIDGAFSTLVVTTSAVGEHFGNVAKTYADFTMKSAEIIDNVVAYFVRTSKGMAEDFEKFWGWLIGLFVDKTGESEGILSTFLANVGTWWADTWENVRNFFRDVWTTLNRNLSDNIDKAVEFFTALPGRILEALEGAGEWLYQVGKDIVQGLIDGVNSMIQAVQNTFAVMGRGMVANLMTVLGMNSPSRVFRDEVGKMIGLGLLEGIADPAINGRIDSAVTHLVDVPDVALSAAGAGGFPETVTLVDADGALLGHMRVLLERALAPLGAGSVQSSFGVG